MLSLRAALSIVTPPPGKPGRERLKAAIAAKDQALVIVEEARATVERLQAVIDASDDAAKVAADAVRKVNESRAAWVADGCRYSGTRDIQSLETASAEATRAAESAASDAKLVSREIERAKGALASAQIDLRSRETDIAAEIGAIIASEHSTILKRYEQAAAEYRKLRFQLKALQRVLDPGRFDDATLKSSEGARIVEASLVQGSIKSWDAERDEARAHDFCEGERGRDEAALEQLASSWRERAAALRRDPDAE